MGQSGNIPGAIMGKDVGAAMDALKQELSELPDTGAGSEPDNDQGDDDERNNRVALATRAVPLLELLEAATASGANVMWDS